MSRKTKAPASPPVDSSGAPGAPKSSTAPAKPRSVVLLEDGELGRRGAVRVLPASDAAAAIKSGQARAATAQDRGIAGVGGA
jgi:hypothetical protein